MAGFVDVSNMSDLEVKRLCQQDEADQPVRRGRHVRPQPKMHDTDTVFAAAAAAFRLCAGKYIKAGTLSGYTAEGQPIPVISNRDFMVRALGDSSMVTEEDRALASNIRTHYKGLMFKILAGKVLNEFDAKSLALANGDTISDRDIGTVAYLPVGYDRANAKQSVDDRISDARGGHIGQIGDKISFTGEVLRQIHSQQWNCYFTTVITDQDQVVFFSQKNQATVGSKIAGQGTVKTHHADGKTQLNRVKFV
jgi:hypothetical protein